MAADSSPCPSACLKHAEDALEKAVAVTPPRSSTPHLILTTKPCIAQDVLKLKILP